MFPPGLPQYTLGFQVLQWASSMLLQPNDSVSKSKGDTWEFMPDQALFILWFYAVDENGRFLYNRAYRERAKGTGKSPMVAAIACAEFLGPVVFDHFDPDVPGGCVGRQNNNALVWFSAISEDGSKHTYQYACEMLSGRADAVYPLEIGLTKIVLRGHSGKRYMKIITASPKSVEGHPPTFVVKEETQNWLPGDHGDELNRAVNFGLAKTGGRSIEVTNAPRPGAGSIAEATHKAYQNILSGRDKTTKLLFDTYFIKVEDIYDREQAWAALEVMYKNAPWIDVERIWDEILDPASREVDSRRFFFNEMVEPRAQWLKEDEWESCRRDLRLKKTDLISIGFRFKKACCAIVATRLEDTAQFVLKVWEKPPDAGRDWEVPFEKVDDKLRSILEKYNVYNVVASPENFQELLGRLSADYDGSVIVEELWISRNRQKMVDSVEMFETAVRAQRLVHEGDPDLTRHVMNCFTEEIPQGFTIRPEGEHSKNYIVAAEAAVLSMRAAAEAIEDGALRAGPSRYAWSF